MANDYRLSSLKDREKALLTFAALQNVMNIAIDWKQIYSLSRDSSISVASSKPGIANCASAWKRQAKTQDFFLTEVERIKIWISQQQDKAVQNYILSHSETINNTDSNDNDTKENGNNLYDFEYNGRIIQNPDKCNKNVINYSDRGTAIKALVSIANHAKDDKMRLDTIKAISDLQQFKEQASREEQEIKRFYMPLRCNDCELYKRKKEILTTENQ